MHIKRHLSCAAVFVAAAAALSGCSAGGHGEDLGLQDAALERATFTVAEVAGDVERAYVLCPYMGKDTVAQLGFDPDDVPDIDDDARAWETASGIGVIYADGAEPAIEWFEPMKVDACGADALPGDEIDPAAEITVRRETREYADGDTAQVAVLHYPQ